MKYRIFSVCSILILLLSTGCTNSPMSDIMRGGIFSNKAASGNYSATSQAAVPTSTQPNAGASTTLSASGEKTGAASDIPRNLTCDRKWGQDLADDQCNLNFAINLGDVRICKNLTYKSLRESCFYSIGIDRRNLTVCNMVEDDIKRKKCFDVVAQNE